MFQKEVAQRITATVGNEQYGRLSVLANIIADTKILFDVPNTAFVPRPKVQSAVVQIIPNKDKIKNIKDIGKLEKLTARLFGQRRKMIRAIIKTDWTQYGLNGTERAEELSPEIFLKISGNIDKSKLENFQNTFKPEIADNNISNYKNFMNQNSNINKLLTSTNLKHKRIEIDLNRENSNSKFNNTERENIILLKNKHSTSQKDIINNKSYKDENSSNKECNIIINHLKEKNNQSKSNLNNLSNININ